MNIPSKYEKAHWSLFNSLAKFTGGFFVFGAVVFLLSFILEIMFDSSFVTYETILIPLFIVPVFGVFGYLIFKAKPYYPKAFHEYYKSIGKIKDENNITN